MGSDKGRNAPSALMHKRWEKRERKKKAICGI